MSVHEESEEQPLNDSPRGSDASDGGEAAGRRPNGDAAPVPEVTVDVESEAAAATAAGDGDSAVAAGGGAPLPEQLQQQRRGSAMPVINKEMLQNLNRCATTPHRAIVERGPSN